MKRHHNLIMKLMLSVASTAFILVGMQASAMEMIFDKTYNISRRASLTDLTWKSIKFEQVGETRVRYILVAEHLEGKKLEYLSSIDDAISEQIKKKMIPSFDLKKEVVEFDENHQAEVVIELPYDFETRYIAFKVIKKNGGYADYVIRMRFGDYRFMLANKVLNNINPRSTENIAVQDPNELYKQRMQKKRRAKEKVAVEKDVVTVDDLYTDMKPVMELEGESAGTDIVEETSVDTDQEESSLYSEFENLANKYDGEQIVTEEEPIAQDLNSNNIAEELPSKVEGTTEPDVVSSGDGSLDYQEEQGQELTAKDMLAMEPEPAQKDELASDLTEESTTGFDEDMNFVDPTEDIYGEAEESPEVVAEEDDGLLTSDEVVSLTDETEEGSATEETKPVKPVEPWNFVFSSGFVFVDTTPKSDSPVVEGQGMEASDDEEPLFDEESIYEEERLPSSDTDLSSEDEVISFEDEVDKKKDQ